MKNALYIQSGGPTAVINATAYGILKACKDKSGTIGRLFACLHGIRGLIYSSLVDIYAEEDAQLKLLPQTPASIFGSCRYRVPDGEAGLSDYMKILQTLEKFNIGYIFYNGGNGTLRACRKLTDYMQDAGFDCTVIAIPKTVDNDIYGLDHAPGFASAARHVVITVNELLHDIRVYDTGLITVLEVMGRNTGWLAAGTRLCSLRGNGPDLIYTPEYTFNDERFLQDIENVYNKKGKVLVVVSEGVRKTDGTYLFEYGGNVFEDAPQQNMGGITPYLTNLLHRNFRCKIRGIDLGLMQRCAAHTASEVDMEEAEFLGGFAVKKALEGESKILVGLERISSIPYITKPVTMSISYAASRDGQMPISYITPDKNYITEDILPYIQPLVGKIPAYAQLKLNAVERNYHV